jgi:acid phosphatase (class A)
MLLGILALAPIPVFSADLTFPAYLRDDQWEAPAYLPNPPSDHSAITRKELAELLTQQNKRTIPQVRRIAEQAELKPEVFAPVMGRRFSADFLPYTFRLLDRLNREVAAEVDRAKQFWKRPRPHTLDPRIKPCVAVPPTSAYPSGHAAIAYVWARVLADIAPEKTPAIMAMARQIGVNRVVAGLHYPSDFDAGQQLGAVIYEKLMEKSEFQRDFELARRESRAILYKR